MAEPKNIEKAIDSATEAVQLQSAQLDELAASAGKAPGLGIGRLLDVPVRVTVEVGRSSSTLSELVALAPGSLIVLDRQVHEPADVLVNGKIVARGEVVTVDGNYGIRISSIEKA